MLFPAAIGSGASVLTRLRTGDDVTVVFTAAPPTGPASVLVMLYVELPITVPFASGEFTRTTRVTDPDPPAARRPRLQVTTPPAGDPPFEAETKVVFAGRVSEIDTLLAFSLPVFEYDRVQVRLAPA